MPRTIRLRALWWIPLLLLLVSCGDDDDTQPVTEGTLLVRMSLDAMLRGEGSGISARPDSILLDVHSASGSPVASLAEAIPDTGQCSYTFRLAAADDLVLTARLLGAGPLGEFATMMFDRRTGIDMESGVTTEVVLSPTTAVSAKPGITGAPGEPSYVVTWSRVEHASGYALTERMGGSVLTYATPDTSRTFDLAFAAGNARLRTAEAAGSLEDVNDRCYWVVARFPLGDGARSDSTCCTPAVWLDLPRVTGVDPADGASGVARDVDVRVLFDRPMEPTSFADTLVTLIPEASGYRPDLTRTWQEGGRLLVLQPDSSLTRGISYRLRVSTKVKDSNGRPLDQDPSRDGLQAFVSTFSVESYAPLRVASVTPADGATGVLVSTRVGITFDRSVRFETVTPSNFSLRGPAGVLPGRVTQLDAEQRSFEFRTDAQLPYGETIRVRVEPGVLDERGEPLDQDPAAPGLQAFESNFLVEDQPAGPRVAASHPADGARNVAVYDSIVVAFDRAVDPSSVVAGTTLKIQERRNSTWFNVPLEAPPYTQDGIRFLFRPTRNLEAGLAIQIVVLAGPEGVRGADGAPFDQFPAEAGFQSFTASFQAELVPRVTSVTPIDLKTDVAWDDSVVVRFDLPMDASTLTADAFSLSSAGGPAVAAVRDLSADGRTAVLRPADPLDIYTWYEVRVTPALRSADGARLDQDGGRDGHQPFLSSFRTKSEAVAPRVVAVIPQDSIAGVPIETTIEVTFSEPVRPSTVTPNFKLRRGSENGAIVGATVTVASDSMSALLRPQQALDHDTRYHVFVSHLVRDRYNNYLDQDADTPDYQDFGSYFTTAPERNRPRVSSIAPINGTTGVALDTEITLVFSEDMDPGSLEDGLTLWGGGSVVPVTIEFETPSRAVVTPLALDFDTLYMVRVDSLAQDTHGNGLDQEPLTDRHDLFESTFLTLADTFGPQIVDVTPDPGDVDVRPDVVIEILFDEALDGDAAIAATAIWLREEGADTVASTRALDDARRKVTLTPDQPLRYARDYEIHVGPALTDSLGNPFDGDPGTAGNQEDVFSFTVIPDVNAPRVVGGLVFADGDTASTAVLVTSSIHVVFSEPVESTTVDSSSVVLSLGEDHVQATLALDLDGTGLTIDPLGYLEYAEDYVVRIEGVEDLQGNPLDQDAEAGGAQPFEQGFTTEDAPPGQPRVETWSPLDGSLNLAPDYRLRLAFDRFMDAATLVAPTGLLVTRNGDTVDVEIAIEGDRVVTIHSADGWDRGVYSLDVSTSVRDLAGRALDQDPGTPGDQGFAIGYEVGRRPVIDAGAMQCSDAASLEVTFAASITSNDAEITAWTWSWGDGIEDAYTPPDGQSAMHAYACDSVRVLAGCGLGEPCNRSYVVRASATDADGLTGSDATGVSFCAFVAASVDSAEAPTDSVRVHLSRACDPASVTSSSVWLETAVGDPVDAVLTLEDADETVVIAPAAPLAPDAVYRVRADGDLHSATGRPLDQAPCTDGVQEVSLEFRTAAP